MTALTEDFLRDIAVEYQSAVACGVSPIQGLAWKHRVPVNTVRAWVRKARETGAMPPGKPGRIAVGPRCPSCGGPVTS